ncbi:PIN domain-containing protein [Adlercreutzia sp. ZJ154]|uniref:type II toxin-antitoxin system VapC family toxin n=1 Tax=Adlercreutzia sp. ZJ154 TaxID=2709790 RepID=UPI0013EDD1C7|nr:PIN domain-containing protein [Adlercreutzia sp. ZJ154]
MMKVLLDTNIVLDLLLDRQPFVLDAIQIFALAENKTVKLLLSTDAISTIFYIVSKNNSKIVAREAISKLLDYVKLAALDEQAIIRGISYDFSDVEDALVVAVAEREKVDAIVTRNIKDFKNSCIPVITPKELLSSITATKNN